MKRKRQIIAYVATSADGYIARLDGSVDWLDRPRTAGDYGMAPFFRTIDTILWGKKTYDVGLKMGGVGGFGPKVGNYVFTHHPPDGPAPGVEFVNEPVGAFAKRLRAEPGKDIWMMGGAGLITSFLDEGEIDEFIVHVIPTFIGEGIPLVEARPRSVDLSLRLCRRFSDGVLRIHYGVKRRKRRA